MMKFLKMIAVVIAGLLVPSVIADDENPLAIFADYADAVWVTENQMDSGAFRDVSTWKWILGGKAIRTAHSVNEGAYMGETHIWYDGAEKSIRMNYVTTGGFHTEGTAWSDGDRIKYHEVVKGNTGGVSEVEAESWIDAGGDMHVRSRMKAGDAWADWSEYTYVRQE